MTIAEKIRQRKQRWIDFYSLDSRKTDVIFRINYHRPDAPHGSPLWPEYKQQRIEWAWQNYLQGLERVEWLEDDFIPVLFVATGTEIFAEAFGCEVYRPERSYTGAIPMVHSPEEAAKVKKPRLEDTSLMLLFDIADELKKRAGSDALFHIPGMLCPMDIVGTIWDKNDLFVSMLDEPEAVQELRAKCRDLLVEFADEWFRRYGTEFVSHHPGGYMNRGISMTVDEIGNISSDLFKEFFEEDLHFLSSRYGGMAIHSCAKSRHQWDNLRRIPNLMLLNLTQPERVLWEAYDYFKDVTAMWPEKMEGGIPEPLPNPKKEDLPKGCHLVLTENAGSRDDALRICEYLHREYRLFAADDRIAKKIRPAGRKPAVNP